MSKVKKTFDKAGQTMEHDETTPDGPAVKIFYETLLQQRPDSAMAAEWLLKRGLLVDDVAQTWLKKLGNKKGSTASKPAPKRKASADDFDSSPPARKGKGKAPAKKQAKKKSAADGDSSDDEPFEKKPKAAAKKPAAPAKKPAAPAKAPPAKKAAAAADSSDEDERPLSQRTK